MDLIDLVHLTAEKLGEPPNRARLVITTFLDEMRDEIIKGNSVKLPLIGTFAIKECASKNVVSTLMHTNKVIPAYKSVRFVTDKSLKLAIKNQGRV